jgi:lysozyme
MRIAKLLMFEEGLREKAYYCSEGYPTIGIGWKIGGKNQPLEHFKWMQMSKQAALAQCHDESFVLSMQLHAIIDCWQDLNEARQAVLISMAYQMGLTGLMKFKKMIAAIEAGDFVEAAAQGKDSRWASQTHSRANRHMRVILLGNWSPYENCFNKEN